MMAAHKTIGLWIVMMAMLLLIVACKPEQNHYTYSSIFAWEIPWTEEPDGLQAMGLQKRQMRLSN